MKLTTKFTAGMVKSEAPEKIVKIVSRDILALDQIEEFESFPSGCSLIEMAKVRVSSKEVMSISPQLFRAQVLKEVEKKVSVKSH